jgi:hypothetical protein
MKPTQADILVGLAQDVKLFFDPTLDAAFANLAVAEHTETWALRSKAFRRWLVNKFVLSEAKPPGAQAVADAIGALEAAAQFQGYPHCETFVRVAGDDETIYLDLANERWETVRVTAAGWELLREGQVTFRRPRGMRALPTPVHGGRLATLQHFVNAPDLPTWTSRVPWLVSALRAHGPYPVLALLGEQGSAKTTTAEVLKRLTDPGKAMVRAEPRDVRDLMIGATNAWVLVCDNVSHLPSWLCDAFSRMATGGGFSTRELYSDGDEIIFDAERPVILTAIEEVITRPDLLDRAVLVSLPTITEQQRRAEAAFWEEFEKAAPTLLGALLDVVAATIHRFPTVRIDALPRMADFALWSTAAEVVLGLPRHTFMRVYTANRLAAQETAIEASPIGPPVRALADAGGWAGTASELLEQLGQAVPESARRAKDWPRTGRALAGAMRRLAAPLRALGVQVTFRREATAARRRLIVIRQNTGAADSPDRPHRPDAYPDRHLRVDDAAPADSGPSRVDGSPSGSSSPNCASQMGLDDVDDLDDEMPLHSEGCDCRRCCP